MMESLNYFSIFYEVKKIIYLYLNEELLGFSSYYESIRYNFILFC